MYTSIVVGTDGSERATVAVREAVSLAKLTGAAVHGVYVLRPMLTAASAQLDAAALGDHECRPSGGGRSLSGPLPGRG